MDDLRKAYRTAVIIGLAMMASLVVYLIVVAWIDGRSAKFSEGHVLGASAVELVRFILLGVSAVIFIGIRLVGRVLLRSRGAQGSGAGNAAGPLVTAAVVTFTLCEVPALFGLVLYFLGRNTSDFYLFLLISLFFFSTHFPKFGQWEEWVRKRGGGDRP